MALGTSRKWSPICPSVTGLFSLLMSPRFICVVVCFRISVLRQSNIPLCVSTALFLLSLVDAWGASPFGDCKRCHEHRCISMFESLLPPLKGNCWYYLAIAVASGPVLLSCGGHATSSHTQEFQFLDDSDQSPTHAILVVVACALGVLPNKLVPNRMSHSFPVFFSPEF